jgi:uncharacterized protein YciI
MHRFAFAILFSILLAPAIATAQARYVVGFLWRGDAWTPERNARTDSLQAGHMANLMLRYQEGWLVGSGPILDPNSSLRGLFFFKADSVAQVEPLVATDPAIAAGRLRIDLVAWQGPAGLGVEYRKTHTANPALRDSMVRYVVAVTNATRMPVKKLGSQLILWGPLADGRELGVLATADTAQARAWLATDALVRPWIVAHGVIPGH